MSSPARAGRNVDHQAAKPVPSTVKVDLSEWKVQLTPARVPAGPVIFQVTNDGGIPHAFEFEAHPWLRPYLAGRLERQLTLFGSDARGIGREAARGIGRALRGQGSGEHWMERLMGPEHQALFREVQAVMSLLEGFSDYVMDEVGRGLVPDVERISARFHERRQQRSGFERAILRLTGMDLKMEQYARGERFDVRGTVLYVLALLCLMYGFTLLPAVFGGVLVGVGLAGLAGFVVLERRIKSPVLDISLFSGNQATSNGGAVYNSGVGGLPNPASPKLQNNTFYANTALGSGGAVFNNNTNGNTAVDSCIFWSNSDASGAAEGEDSARDTISRSAAPSAATPTSAI